MKSIKRLFYVLDRWKFHYLFSGFLLVIAAMLTMLEPKILQVAIDGVVVFFQNDGKVVEKTPDPIAQFLYDVLPTIRMDNLEFVLLCIAGLFVSIAVVRAGTQFWSSVITASCTEKAIKKLRDKLFLHIQLLPIKYFDSQPTGELIQRCTGDVDTVKDFIGTQVVELVRTLAIFSGAVFVMWQVHVTYTLFAILLVPFIIVTAIFFFRKEAKVWEEHEDEQDKLTKIIQQNLNGIRVVQAFARENYEIKKFNQQNQKKLAVGLKHIDLHKNFWSFSDFLVNLQVLISLSAGAYFTIHQQITMGEFASLFTYSIIVTWPMRSVGRVISKMGMATVAMERMALILDAEEEDYTGTALSEKLKGEVVFENVSFKYKTDEEQYALKNVSFRVKAGEKVALIGATGAGKSSIIALLTRLYEPTEGRILLDGLPLQTISKTDLRQKIGVVQQNAFLFSATIKENMAFTKVNASNDDVVAIAKAAAIDDFIQRLPQKYETVVGEKGVTLSGGQKQRVALARTLLSDPDILVLDDATSAVDTETEAVIQAALTDKMADKTTFIIAHRLTAIQDADLIIVFDKGEIVEMGTQEELLETNGFYKQVYDIQIAIEEEISGF